MQSITSSSYSSSLSGYGGLASGLDRDSLIEGMLYGSQVKIDNQKKEIDKLSWEQEAIREITSSMYDFTTNYTSFSSATNLLSSQLYSGSSVTATGDNSDFVSVTANNAALQTFSILGIKSLASDAQMISNSNVSGQTLTTDAIFNDFTKTTDVSTVKDKYIAIAYGSTRHNIFLSSDEEYDYSNLDKVAESMNKLFAEEETTNGKTLDEVIKAEVVDGKLVLKDVEGAGNKIEIAGASDGLLESLGFMTADENIGDLEGDRIKITTSGLTAAYDATLTEAVSIKDQMKDQTMRFTYNGTTVNITLGEYDTMDDYVADLQKQLDDEFGNNRIKVTAVADGAEKSSLSFETIKPDALAADGYSADSSSSLSIDYSSGSLGGASGLLGISNGESNRLNLNASINDSGLVRSADTTGEMTFNNGSVTVDLTEHGLDWNSTIDEIIDTINSIDDLDVNIQYQKETDKFIVTSTQSGASGEIALSGTVAEAMFGTETTDYTVTDGVDAVVRVQYSGTSETMELVRSSNNFSMDGLSVTLEGEFGYDVSGNYIEGTEAIEFETEVDVDKVTEAVKTMIDDYNEIIEQLSTQVNQKPDRDYTPLTDAEREEMTESQIEMWEEKAKAGLLFNDRDLTALLDELRFVLPATMYNEFKEIGITTSSDYSDNGKLVFDEAAFKAAMVSDPDGVEKLISGAADSDGEGYEGLINAVKDSMDKYAGMTGADKGILVDRAGSVHAPTSVISNSIQDQIDDIDAYVDRLIDSMEMEQDRYISQFTALEVLISEMNSQSSYLASMFSY